MYESFATLKTREKEGIDFKVSVTERESPVAVVALHGGSIEPGTSEIARLLAGEDFSCYAFEGMKRTHNFKTLHIPSCFFDEPRCLRLVNRSAVVVTVHGCRDKDPVVRIGGRDAHLSADLQKALYQAGIPTQQPSSGQAGWHMRNVCNQGISGKGVQFEISAALRREFFPGLRGEDAEGGRFLERFVHAVRAVLLSRALSFQQTRSGH